MNVYFLHTYVYAEQRRTQWEQFLINFFFNISDYFAKVQRKIGETSKNQQNLTPKVNSIFENPRMEI